MKAKGNLFFISDPHFSHANLLTGMKNGVLMKTHIRSGFSSVEEMDETIVNRWNATVKPHDKIYLLGDIAMKKEHVHILSRLNGKKRLILGNHDTFGTKFYAPYFDEIYAMRTLCGDGILATHFPVHPQSVKRGYVNVHGHIHNSIVGQDTRIALVPFSEQHPKYFNVCVEHHDYTPVHIDIIRAYAKNQEYYD